VVEVEWVAGVLTLYAAVPSMASVTCITYAVSTVTHPRVAQTEHAVMLKTNELLHDDYSTAFVQWLTTRTIEGLALWENRPNGLISRLSGSMFVQFITCASPWGQAWRLFTVRDSNGELFQTTASTAGIETAPLAAAVQALFLTIVWPGSHRIH